MVKTCNKCGEDMRQHKTEKKYFFCKKCDCWFKCWLPATKKEIERMIARAKEKGYY